MATSGSTSVAVTSYDTLKFSWSKSSSSTANNTTTINWKMELIATNYGYISSSVAKNWSVNVNGSTYSGTNSVAISNNSTKTLASGSTTISHNSDGSKSFSYSFSQEFNITFSGSKINTISGSGSGTLDTIPRNSTTNSKPVFTVPGSVKCDINRYATFKHRVLLQLKNSNGQWEDCGDISNIDTSVTFSGEAVNKRCFQVLNGRSSCQARFAVYTIGPNGWTNGPEGTCTRASLNTVSAPTFTATNSATTTITKGNSGYTTTLNIKVNGYVINAVTQTSATSYTFNNTTNARKMSITGLAQSASKRYVITATTYYSGVTVGTTTATGTCNAPAVDTITKPNFTAGNNFVAIVTTASSELSRAISFQIQNSSGSWINIATQGQTTTKSFTWGNTEAQRNTIFNNLGTAVSRATRIVLTTYYQGVQVRSANVVTSGTCTAPALSTASAPKWTVGSTLVCTITRASSLLTHQVELQVKNSAGNFVTIQNINTNATSINLANTTALNTTIFRDCLAQAASRDARIIVKTYYGNIQIRGTSSTSNGTATAPAASTLSTSANWTAGDSFTLNITRANSSLKHKVEVRVNSQLIYSANNIDASTSFGTTDAQRIAVFNALANSASKGSEISLYTYYNGIQVRTKTTKTGTCSAPGTPKPTAANWTAGNSFVSTIDYGNSRTYLYYDIELKVGSQSVEKYQKTKNTSLSFASTAEKNLLAYRGLNTNAQATSQLIVTLFYKREDNNNYIQVGPSVTTTGTCRALEVNTISAPNWTAGNSFTANITKKSTSLYSAVKLKVNGQTVQQYTISQVGTKNSLEFGNSVAVNTNIFTALAQTTEKGATFEITSYYGTSETNVMQVRTPYTISGKCRASETSKVKNLTPGPASAIIDGKGIVGKVIMDCEVTDPMPNYEIRVKVFFNGVPIGTEDQINNGFSVDENNQFSFNTEDYVEELYQAIPTQKSGSLQFRVITLYNGVQVKTPEISEITVVADENLIKIKIDDTVLLKTIAYIADRDNNLSGESNDFVDNQSMLGSKMSRLAIEIAKGYFYLQTKYGGYISQINACIANSSSMLQLFSYTSEDKIYNLERTRIINPDFKKTDESDNRIIMGPYDFTNITKAGTINNLIITAMDSRGYSSNVTIPLKIFPYSDPTIKIDSKTTDRKTEDKKFVNFNLSGTVSSLFKMEGEEKVQTNTLRSLKVKYRLYGSTEEYSIFDIPQTGNSKFSYTDEYTKYILNGYSSSGLDPYNGFNINDTYEILIVAEDMYGRTATGTIIILPDKPLMSFREQQIGINTIPRKIGHITGRISDENESPALDIAGYIYTNGREVAGFSIVDTWYVDEDNPEVLEFKINSLNTRKVGLYYKLRDDTYITACNFTAYLPNGSTRSVQVENEEKLQTLEGIVELDYLIAGETHINLTITDSADHTAVSNLDIEVPEVENTVRIDSYSYNNKIRSAHLVAEQGMSILVKQGSDWIMTNVVEDVTNGQIIKAKVEDGTHVNFSEEKDLVVNDPNFKYAFLKYNAGTNYGENDPAEQTIRISAGDVFEEAIFENPYGTLEAWKRENGEQYLPNESVDELLALLSEGETCLLTAVWDEISIPNYSIEFTEKKGRILTIDNDNDTNYIIEVLDKDNNVLLSREAQETSYQKSPVWNGDIFYAKLVRVSDNTEGPKLKITVNDSEKVILGEFELMYYPVVELNYRWVYLHENTSVFPDNSLWSGVPATITSWAYKPEGSSETVQYQPGASVTDFIQTYNFNDGETVYLKAVAVYD